VPKPTSFGLFPSNPRLCFQKVDTPDESHEAPLSASPAMSYVHFLICLEMYVYMSLYVRLHGAQFVSDSARFQPDLTLEVVQFN
jgi:hypothetical protein